MGRGGGGGKPHIPPPPHLPQSIPAPSLPGGCSLGSQTPLAFFRRDSEFLPHPDRAGFGGGGKGGGNTHDPSPWLQQRKLFPVQEHSSKLGAAVAPGDFPSTTPPPPRFLWVPPAPGGPAKEAEKLRPKKNAAGQVGQRRVLEGSHCRRGPPEPKFPPEIAEVPPSASPELPEDVLLNLLLASPQPTETERCIESLLAVFQRYAGREGDNHTLSKREFLAFMNTELAAFTKNQKDPAVLDRMMKKLDLNSDGQLDFPEFLNLIGGIAVACHDTLVVKPPVP
uniref:Protein S100-A11 n=1 Tax=Calidris pygmaea TaxID=425635 RepID=A0A8C3JFR0_9CHAR